MRVPTAWQVRDFAATTSVVFVLYFAAYFIVWAIITPLQHAIIPDITAFASLLFLPHGIRVLATSLVGGKAVLGMILAELAGNYFFWGIHSAGLLIALSVASGCVTWLVFELLRAGRLHAYFLRINSAPPPFHTLILAGVLASAANAFLVTAIMEGTIRIVHVTSVLAAYMTGDITGLLMVMMAAKYVLPLVTGADE